MLSTIMDEVKKYAEMKAQAELFANTDLVQIARDETIEYLKERYTGFEEPKNDYRFPAAYDEHEDCYYREYNYVKPIFKYAIEKGVVDEDEWEIWERVHNLNELFDTDELMDCEVMMENYVNYRISLIEEK